MGYWPKCDRNRLWRKALEVTRPSASLLIRHVVTRSIVPRWTQNETRWEDVIDRDAHELRVTYDQSTGIPVDIWIDYDEHIADEEQGYSVTLPIDTDPGS